jgi:hypothetical protein
MRYGGLLLRLGLLIDVFRLGGAFVSLEKLYLGILLRLGS